MLKKISFRELAKLITGIENRNGDALRSLAVLSSQRRHLGTQGRKHVLGITGPPGAGKSSLVDGIIKLLRKKGRTVAVVAIDPSSPFSGGAILGDRIRMQEHAGDKGVFIRSVGSRGSHGGLSRATSDIVRAYQAYGFDDIIVETVGVGQTELDIMEIADVTVVVLVPESGDMVQTMKAGLLEIADVFVVNKADRPGAEQMKNWLTGMFDTGAGMDEEAVAHHANKIPPPPPLEKGGRGGFKDVAVLLTQANKVIGLDELMNEIERRAKAMEGDEKQKKRKENIRRREFLDMCAEEFKERICRSKHKKLIEDIAKGKISPYAGLKVVDKLMKF